MGKAPQPFVGVAPRRYLDLFSLGEIERKDKSGRIREWCGALATPRLGEYSFRTGKINELTELEEFNAFADELSAKGFVESDVKPPDNAGEAHEPPAAKE